MGTEAKPANRWKLRHTEVPKLVTGQTKNLNPDPTDFESSQGKQRLDCAKIKAEIIKANTSRSLCRANEGEAA